MVSPTEKELTCLVNLDVSNWERETGAQKNDCSFLIWQKLYWKSKGVRWQRVRWLIRRLPVQFRPCQMTLCPCARHFTLLASGNVPVYCKLLWKGTKCKCASWLEEVDGEDVTLQHLSPHLAGTVCWPDGLKNFLCHAHLAQLSCSHPT